MSSPAAAAPAAIETVAELRSLYRAAEARAARLRLLVEAGRDLAAADAAILNTTLAVAARRAALFMGHVEGRVVLEPTGEGIPLTAPGAGGRVMGALLLEGGAGPGALEPEDADALSMLAQLMGAAVDRVRRDAEREALLEALRERERRLEAVILRLFTAQEEERRRVSRDLHDGVAQTATALFRRLDAKGDEALEGEAVKRAAAIAQGLVREIRAAIADLRPTALDDLGLVAAVRTLAQPLSEQGYAIDLAVSGPERWPQVLETAFFRIAQEALSNVRKHAGGPCRVEITLSGEPQAARWRLRVRDHGRGPPATAAGFEPGAGVGMAVMRERMAVLGGALEVRSPASSGLELVAEVEGRW